MTKLIFTGGFLGAGKTTLLYEVTQLLNNRGLKVGVITNDQAPDLADTTLLEHGNMNIAEVSGSCFCCDFKGLRKAMEKVGKDFKTDVILAEPVGSCTDLSATLINPIQDMMKSEISVCPLTVLADPARLKDIIEGGTAGLHSSAAYIYRKQLEESDIILITKTDLYTKDEIRFLSEKLGENFPECRIFKVSARTGEGMEEWLDYILSHEEAGKHIVDIDYNRYAEGEAVLGWLNCSASLSGHAINWDDFTKKLMQHMAGKFDRNHTPIGHVKMMVENGDTYISANLTGRSETLTFRWEAGLGNEAEMIVNARVEMEPKELEVLFLESLKLICGNSIKYRINRIRSISPGYPKPTHRYKK
jgi:G3E family GTPase